jgi:hypothetical protein
VLKAVADIKKGEACLFVPKKLLLSTDRARELNNPFQQKMAAAGLHELGFPADGASKAAGVPLRSKFSQA